jgi:hypothetical protein
MFFFDKYFFFSFPLSVPELYESTVLRIVPANPDTRLSMISDTGALCAYSGQRTG